MEFVYVLKRSDLFEDEGTVQGFLPLEGEALERRFLRRIRERGFFLERERAERDADFKQIIPYSVVTTTNRVFAFRRLEGQAETRLRRKSSIGIGGHIEPSDAGAEPVRVGCLRELGEELAIEGPLDPEPVGVLNDERNEVGAVHFGVVHRVRTEAGAVRVRETQHLTGSFETPAALRQRARAGEDFETWSEYLLGSLVPILRTRTVAGRNPA